MKRQQDDERCYTWPGDNFFTGKRLRIR